MSNAGTNHDKMTTREIGFFSFQGLIPTIFALLPVGLTLAISKEPVPDALARIADGTLVLISFTMLISLSQDLKDSVRPNIHAQVERLELFLRVGAIMMIAVYTFFQAIAVAKPETDLSKDLLNKWLTGLAFAMLVASVYACRLTLKTLRPHFNKSE